MKTYTTPNPNAVSTVIRVNEYNPPDLTGTNDGLYSTTCDESPNQGLRSWQDGFIAGNVSKSGSPVPSLITLSLRNGPRISQQATDSTGNYQFNNLDTRQLYDVQASDQTGGWEDIMSTRRTPKLLAPFTTNNVMTTGKVGYRVGGSVMLKAGKGPFTLSVASQPTGSNFVISRRQIYDSGSISATGIFSINVTATDANGQTVNFTSSITVS